MRLLRLVALASCVLLPWLLAASPGLAEQKLALVIGNDDYAHVSHLERAVGDAKAVEAAFERLGFSVTLVTNVDLTTFAKTIAQFEAKIQPGDIVALHYSGHGIDIAGRNYLIPVDMISPEPGQESAVARLAMDAGALIDEIRERDPRLVFAILDACRNNPFTSTGRSIGSARGLARMVPQPGEFILFSAGPGEEALDRLGDDDHADTSVFTRVLLEHIETPGQSLQDLAKATQGEVHDLAAKVNHEQFPDYFDRTIDKPVLKEASPPATDKVASVPAPPAEGAARSSAGDSASLPQPSAEIEFWDSIKNSMNKDYFKGYLEQFPNGVFASIARTRIAELESARPEQAKPKPAPDEVEWQRLASSTDAADFESFVRTFPESSHRVEAQTKAQSLRPKAEPPPTPQDQLAWQRIANSTDPSDFKSFARTFPDSVHRTEAEAKVAKLEYDAKFFMLKVCNKSTRRASVAAMGRTTPDSDDWHVQGWWTVPAGQCTALSKFVKGTIHVFAQEYGNSSFAWKGNGPKLCVDFPGPFDRVNNDGYNCRSSEKQASFSSFTVTDETFTWDLKR
jgi:uncharacterized membrane protein